MAGGLPDGVVDYGAARALFAELVAGAIERTRVEPTPVATAYLVGLLDERVRHAPLPRDPNGAEETLAEGLLRARQECRAVRLGQLRSLGDRALFAAGFFGDYLERRIAGLRYYGEAGRLAYSDLSTELRGAPRGCPPGQLEPRRSPLAALPELFEELADRFSDFVEVLTEVGDCARTRSSEGLARLHGRYLRTGSERDRRRLVRRGHTIPVRGPLRDQ